MTKTTKNYLSLKRKCHCRRTLNMVQYWFGYRLYFFPFYTFPGYCVYQPSQCCVCLFTGQGHDGRKHQSRARTPGYRFDLPLPKLQVNKSIICIYFHVIRAYVFIIQCWLFVCLLTKWIQI